MALNMYKMWINGIEKAFFSKKLQKNCAAAWVFAPWPRFVMRLSYAGLLNKSPKLDICTF